MSGQAEVQEMGCADQRWVIWKRTGRFDDAIIGPDTGSIDTDAGVAEPAGTVVVPLSVAERYRDALGLLRGYVTGDEGWKLINDALWLGPRDENDEPIYQAADQLRKEGTCPRCDGAIVSPARHGEGWCIDVR